MTPALNGARAPVRQSLLRTPRWGHVPVRPMVGNLMGTSVLFLSTMNWKWIPLGVAVHLVMIVATRKNVHAIQMFLRHILRPRVLRSS